MNRSFIGFGRPVESPKKREPLPEDLQRNPLVQLMAKSYPFDPRWKSEQSIRDFLQKLGGDGDSLVQQPNADSTGAEHARTSEELSTKEQDPDFALMNDAAAWRRTKRL
jgi:hypothetical protein